MSIRLPSNAAAEQAILGALLLKDELYHEISDEITSEDFYDPGHAAVFRTIESLINSGKRVNATLVSDYLSSTDARVKVDAAYLEQLVDAVAALSDTIHYARQVADLARRRRLILAMMEGAGELSKLDPNTPSQSLIDKIETDILGASRIAQTSLRRLGEWAQRSTARVIDALERPSSRTNGIRWRLTAVDNVAGPLLPGKLVILGGRPGSGKSALAGQAAEAFGEQQPGYIQSLEMEGEEWAERLMAQHSDIPAWRINLANLNEGDIDKLLDAQARLRGLPVWLDHKPRLTIEQIRARAIRYKHKFGIGWMVLDHIHIAHPSQKKQDKFDLTNEVCYELKQLAKDLKIAVLALAQLNKEVRQRDDGRPRAGDLLYYSAIEPHADSIIFTHRAEIAHAERKPSGDENDPKYKSWDSIRQTLEGRAEIINAKRRSGKSYQTCECSFHGPTMRFGDLQAPRPTAGQLMEKY
jgi:replicative DNA helicase